MTVHLSRRSTPGNTIERAPARPESGMIPFGRARVGPCVSRSEAGLGASGGGRSVSLPTWVDEG